MLDPDRGGDRDLRAREQPRAVLSARVYGSGPGRNRFARRGRVAAAHRWQAAAADRQAAPTPAPIRLTGDSYLVERSQSETGYGSRRGEPEAGENLLQHRDRGRIGARSAAASGPFSRLSVYARSHAYAKMSHERGARSS